MESLEEAIIMGELRRVTRRGLGPLRTPLLPARRINTTIPEYSSVT